MGLRRSNLTTTPSRSMRGGPSRYKARRDKATPPSWPSVLEITGKVNGILPPLLPCKVIPWLDLLAFAVGAIMLGMPFSAPGLWLWRRFAASVDVTSTNPRS